MNIFSLVSLLLSKKFLGLICGAALLSLSTTEVVVPHMKAETEKNNSEKAILLTGTEILHEGVNDFIEVQGWDGQNYRVSIELGFRRKKNGIYIVNQPKFFMVQEASGNPLTYSSLNIIGQDKIKIRYTCITNSDSSIDGNVDMVFYSYCGPKPATETGGKEKCNCITFVSPEGEKWDARIDSTYIPVSDTNALLRFRLTRG